MPRLTRRADRDRALTVLATTTVVAFLAFALYWGRTIFIPFALAVFLAFILGPLVVFLERRRFGRVPSVLVVMAGAVVVFGLVLYVVGGQLFQLVESLPDNADRIRAKVAAVKGWISSDPNGRTSVFLNEMSNSLGLNSAPANAADPEAPTVVVAPQPTWMAAAGGYVTPAAGIVGQGALTFILLVFILMRREDLRNRMIRLIGEGQVTTTTKAVDDTSRRLSRYLLVQFLLNAAFGVVITLGLLTMGIGYAPIWGFLAFLMRYVPYIGTWLGVIPPALFAFVVADSWWPVVGVLVLFIGLELLCNNIVEPLLYGSSLGLSEVAQLVATAFWAFLWGPVGMILAWPLTTCLLIVGKYVPQWGFLNVLLGDQPVLPASVTFYQRLAARDQDEAADILIRELAKREPEAVCDDLIVSALSQARQDQREGTLADDDVKFIGVAVREIAEDLIDSTESEGVASPVPLLVVPARDDLDRVAATVLTRIMDTGLWAAEVMPASNLSSEVLAQVSEIKPAVIVIASVWPGGLTHTRYLCKRIRAQFPDVKIIVGRWAGTGEEATAREQLKAAGADQVETTIAATRTFVQGWQAVFAAGANPAQPSAKGYRDRDQVVGTVSA